MAAVTVTTVVVVAATATMGRRKIAEKRILRR